MGRLFLSLLLALSLWPSPAAASGAVPVREHRAEIRGITPDLAAAALGAAGGADLLRGIDPRCSGGCMRGCTHRFGPDPLGKHSPLACGMAPALHAPTRAVRRADEADRAAVPLCERLPYQATAPPSWR